MRVRALSPENRFGAEALPRWHIITGEYPPQPGGVADYTYLVAHDLAKTGAEVHVWTAPAERAGAEAGDVTVHRSAGRWSRADLACACLDELLDAFPQPRRLLVQYTPSAWGYKGTNLGFCRWLGRRRGIGDEIWTMIHESAYPWRLIDKPSRLVLAAIHRVMLRALLRASARVYYSNCAHGARLKVYAPARQPMIWLPVPSNVPVVADPEGAAGLRRRLAPAGQMILGNFGTFGDGPCRNLRRTLPPLLLGHPERIGLLLGRNGGRLEAELRAKHPELAGRLIATGGLAPEAVSLHLQACDVLVMPYEDGVSTRRGTVMAGLAHGRPIATNLGPNSEPIWAESGCVAAAPGVDYAAVVRVAESLLADPGARDRLGAAARAVYDRHFALERTTDALIHGAPTAVGREG
jgi:glycosyltransferase involved in cell wall biosynthesis